MNKAIAKQPNFQGITDQILDAMPYPVLMLDKDNVILYANLASEGFFQSSTSLLCGEAIDKILPFGTPALDMLERVRLRFAPIQEYKVDLSSPRIGQDAVVDIFATPMNEIPGHTIIIFQKRAMADKIDRQLTHRGAARTVTGLASMLAHEIKNPLSGIRGAAQLLENSVESEDRSLTQLITRETDRIVKLVDRMEVFSDERPPERDPVNIHSVLDHVRTLALNGFGRGVEFIENYDPSLPAVYANRDQLVQVFINLIKNACEAMDDVENRQITISTAFRSGIKLSTPGSEERISLPLEFTIADNGNGIAPSLVGHVFEPFVTTKSNGTGLGLALVSKIVGDHGGIIEIESDAKGTTVRILMPAWSANEEAREGSEGEQ
ncbi:MAG: ATP-binding protein [Rhizobiaceae bacterium]|nr:ATP-binding protein [Rhizobiaceae bacterium]